jgi:hypothetical protein
VSVAIFRQHLTKKRGCLKDGNAEHRCVEEFGLSIPFGSHSSAFDKLTLGFRIENQKQQMIMRDEHHA